MTIEGLDGKFNPEYWNYAKLISGVLRYGMPIDQVIKLVQGMELNSESINTWKNGVERALKKIFTERHGSERAEMSELWVGDLDLSRRLFDLHELRSL